MYASNVLASAAAHAETALRVLEISRDTAKPEGELPRVVEMSDVPRAASIVSKPSFPQVRGGGDGSPMNDGPGGGVSTAVNQQWHYTERYNPCSE